VKAKGKLVLLIQSEQITEYGSRIDYPLAMNRAADKGAEGTTAGSRRRWRSAG
jgi:hypothetical protein